MRASAADTALTSAYDVAVVGGGASGLAAALAAARAGARVVVLERDVACGLSILVTGNGRCNLSNEHLEPARYRHPAAARAVMGDEPERDLAAFFASVGIWTVAEGEGRLYPYSRRAASVRDALVGACAREGVALRGGCTLAEARWDARGAHWELTVREPERPLRPRAGRDEKAALRAARRALAEAPLRSSGLRARAVVLAPGGHAEGVCRLFGLPHREERPVLCPVAGAVTGLPDATAALDGVRVHAALSLAGGDGPAWREAGEVLFRPYGISGIVAFNLSRRARPGDAVELDLFPEMGEDELAAAFGAREGACGPAGAAGRLGSWFDGVLDRRVGRLVRDVAAATGVVTPGSLAHAAKHLAFEVAGTADERAAQVRAGGIPFAAVELPDLRVRAGACGAASGGGSGDLGGAGDSGSLGGAGASALFACGEALDMDADCGGFNLAWAWLSGLRAGTAAAAAFVAAGAPGA